jgi:uncharacterized protein (DUF433 family)
MSEIAKKFEGIYDVPSAAKYILAGRGSNEVYRVTSRHLIRWIRSGLTQPELAGVPGSKMLITFEDLVSVRIIAALRNAGVSWPKIYDAEAWLREHTGHSRPFATEQVWTTRSVVFSRFKKLLIAASRHGQQAMDVLEDYLIPISGLSFDRSVAAGWDPQDLIHLDPKVQFGAPCIKGTRIPTRSAWGMIAAGDSRDLVLRSYSISDEELDAALSWEERLAA